MANDGTIALSPAAPGGDTLDASVVTEGGATVKRERVVLAGDSGGGDVVTPVNADPGANPVPYAEPVLSMALVDDTPQIYIAGQLRPVSMTPEGRIRVAPVSPDLLDAFPVSVGFDGFVGGQTFASFTEGPSFTDDPRAMWP